MRQILSALIVTILICSNAAFTLEKRQIRPVVQTIEKYRTAEEAGFSSAKLQEASNLYKSHESVAGGGIVVIYKGKVLAEWGDYTQKINCHSLRKSLLSVLFGIFVDNGTIDLSKTLAELNIDDDPPLNAAEKTARIIHLLKARSGVYHAAAAETQDMRDLRPERNSHAPDTFWYYNNWDFNALGAIFRQETGLDLFEEFKKRIADPIGMQDFLVSDCEYVFEREYSIHPQYAFRMSARDRARFGQLVIQNGKWGDTQLISEKWIKDSTTSYSSTDDLIPGLGYGYMWWIMSKEGATAMGMEHFGKYDSTMGGGYNGQDIFITPEADLVIGIATDTDRGMELTQELGTSLLEMIVKAKEFEINDLEVLLTKSSKKKLTAPGSFQVSATVRNLSRDYSTPARARFYLSKNQTLDSNDILVTNRELKKIAPGETLTMKNKAKLPKNIKKGKYYLFVSVDDENKNFDPYLENNVGMSKRKITVRLK